MGNQVKEVWNQRVVTVDPVIVGAMGGIPHSLHLLLDSFDEAANLF